MKMKSRLTDGEAGDSRRAAGNGKPENSPVRSSLGARASSSRVIQSKAGSKGPGPSSSPGPRTSSGAGRTPQTKRRELSLTTAEKNSPSGSPRNVTRTSSSGNVVRTTKTATSKTKGDSRSEVSSSNNNEESSRKSSNSSQDSGIGREHSKLTRGERTRSGQNLTKSLRSQPPPPLIRTNSPERTVIEVSDRKRFEELCDIKNIELGMVKVPPDILEDLINKENIEKFYDVDEVPVAR